MTRKVASTAPTAVIVAVLLLLGWLLLAPAQLGGANRYAVVEGASMEPDLSRGDLVVVRAGGEPEIGDVVFFHDEALDVQVLHRVIDKERGRLVLKGDANDFVDDARPLPSELTGSLWFSIPRVGAALLWVRQPLHAAIVVFFLTLVAFTGGSVSRTTPRGETSRG